MKKYQFFVSLFLVSSAFADTAAVEKRVKAHLAINDPASALACAREALLKEPENRDLIRLEVQALAKKGDIACALSRYKQIDDQKLLEDISWACIKEGAKSSSPSLREEALISAFVTNDAESIPLCLNGLDDPNQEVRALALTLAGHARDRAIEQKLVSLLETSSAPNDRVAAIHALGASESPEVTSALTDILTSDTASIDEQIAAQESLVKAFIDLDRDQIQKLVSDKRSSLKALGCQLVLERQDKSRLPLIVPCLFDSSHEVQYLALQCVGTMGGPDFVANSVDNSVDFCTLLTDRDQYTALFANWVELVQGNPKVCDQFFKKSLTSYDKEFALTACACIVQAGSKGTNLALWGIAEAKEPLVSLNLSLSLIWQRKELSLAKDAIVSALHEKKERLSWHQKGIFSYIGPTKVPHVPQVLSLPEAVDMLTRLELYSYLAGAKTIDLKEYVLDLLQERTWGISGQTATLLLEQGDDIFSTLKDLLTHKNPEIALQAAFLLASYTQDEQALKVFETQYTRVLRPLKEQILIGIGQIGSRQSIPFLVDVLDSPFESIRIKAARSILLCLNH